MAQDPRERNRALLNTVFGFRNEAPLKKFIQDRTNRREEHFTLKEILESLKEAISAGRWFDNNNPSIIICPPELEAVIDQKALHVLQVKDLVLSQLIPMDSQKNKENQEDKTNPISTTTTLILLLWGGRLSQWFQSRKSHRLPPRRPVMKTRL